MLSNRISRRDPVLDIKRDAFLADEKERIKSLVEDYKLSISKTKHVHANLLFTTNHGLSMLAEICRMVTYIEPSVLNNSWQNLAVKLGYNDVDIKCLNNLRGTVYDPTEMVLRFYAANEKDGTVSDILQALLELKFLPALQRAQEHIDMFLTEVETGKIEVIEAPINTGEPESKKLLKAANFKPFIPVIFDAQLPKERAVEPLGHNVNNSNNNRERELMQRNRAPSQTKPQKKYCKYVLLSFAGDGYSTALKIASILRATKNKKGIPIGVVLLCENDEKIQGNPGIMILELLSKMDFVVPVLTEGYFSALNQPNSQASLIDERYVQYIHSILVSKFIHNGCFNILVRPVIPSHVVNEIYYREEFIHNSIFSAWKSDEDAQALADSIVRARRNRISTG